jgi:recombination protein RecA
VPPKKKPAPDAKLTPQQIMAEINSVIPGATMLGSDPDMEVRRWPTGVAPLDYALDGGLPRGRFIEVYGPYSVLKSWWAYKSIAAVQAAGGRCALVDTEHSWDAEWGARLGIDVDTLLVVRPDIAEDAILSLQALINQKYDLLVFDSIAAAVPGQIANARPGEDNAPGALARVMSRGLARLTAVNKHTTVFCINQTREKIGISFGSPVTTSGGKAMGYYASYRVSFVRVGKIREATKTWDGEKMADSQKIVAHKIKATL